MAVVNMVCGWCRLDFQCERGRVNQAAAIGAPLYCGKVCAGFARRVFKSPEQKKADKAAYDAQRRIDLANRIKAEKAARHKATYDPAKAAIERKARAHKHVAYCQRPEYRAWKSAYDMKRRAKKDFGEFAEASLLLRDLENEIDAKATRYEVYQQNGTLNKAQTRRRSL